MKAFDALYFDTGSRAVFSRVRNSRLPMRVRSVLERRKRMKRVNLLSLRSLSLRNHGEVNSVARANV